MDRKLLFFDIDGTLLSGGFHGHITAPVMDALKQAKANGHLLFINSGRTYGMLPAQVLTDLFDGHLCGCGTQIIIHGKTVYHHSLPKELRQEIPSWFISAGMQGVFEGPSHCYFSDHEKNMYPCIRAVRDLYKNTVGDEAIRTFADEDMDFSKFIVIGEEESQMASFRAISQDHFDYIERERMGTYYFGEIVPHNHSKASAIDYICQHYGLSLDDCYAFGDSTNDLSMLRHVRYSVGMGNSAPEVLDKVSYITTSVERDGIAIALKHFGLI